MGQVPSKEAVDALLEGLNPPQRDAVTAGPGPIAAQVGQGFPWSVFTLVGVGLGVWLALRRPLTRAVLPGPAWGTAGQDDGRGSAAERGATVAGDG